MAAEKPHISHLADRRSRNLGNMIFGRVAPIGIAVTSFIQYQIDLCQAEPG